MLREQLWQSGAELQQQADFCSGLGSTACSLLWSSSAKESTVTHWLAEVSHFLKTVCGSMDYILSVLLDRKWCFVFGFSLSSTLKIIILHVTGGSKWQ